MDKTFDIVLSDEFKKILKKLNKMDKVLYGKVEKKMINLGNNPYLGKPLRNVLKNRRRLQIGSFVLVYRITENEIRFLDFDHHDRIYKKL